jgi:flagellar motor switch protein FliM
VSEVLSQEEIEALLNSLGDGGADEPAPVRESAAPAPSASPAFAAPQGGHTIAYEVYDFRRPDKFSKEQLRTLQMLHETFARLTATSLSAQLRAPVHMELVSLEQVPYEEYLRSLNKSVFAVMTIPPLSGEAAFEMEFDLLFVILDRMLGGPGHTTNRTSLTDVELPLARQVVERIFSSLRTAWEGVVVVNPTVDAIETSAQFVQIAPPTDVVVSLLFEMRIGEARGAVSMCIPYMLLKPITAKLSSQKWFAVSSNRKPSRRSRRNIEEILFGAKLACSVELGSLTIPLSEFAGLQEGDVLRLDRAMREEIVMRIHGRPKFLGRPARDGRKVVFAVTQALDGAQPS